MLVLFVSTGVGSSSNGRLPVRADARFPRASVLARHLIAALASGHESNAQPLADLDEAGYLVAEVARSARFERRAYVAAEAPLGDTICDLLSVGLGARTRVVFDEAVLADATGMGDVVRSSRAADVRRAPSLPYTLIAADGMQAVVAWPRTSFSGPVALLVRPSLLLTLLVDTFEVAWAHADPVALARPVRRAGAVPPSTENQVLLALLALGGTDQSIAGSLHLSTRSVQRRISGLMDLLGVHTRFQVGLEAVRLGWV